MFEALGCDGCSALLCVRTDNTSEISTVTTRLKNPSSTAGTHPSRSSGQATRVALAAFIIGGFLFCALFAFYSFKYERLIDQRLSGPIFSNAAKIYARPKTVRVGQTISPSEIVHELRRAGYSDQNVSGEGGSRLGNYRLRGDAIEVYPGPESYHNQDSAVIRIANGQVAQISAHGADGDITAYELEPQLVTALSSSQVRAKRQIVRFEEIPPVMVKATLAIEDRRFFEHGGVNYFRLVEATLADLRSGGKGQGGSTITMQMARAFFLSPRKTFTRKALEMLIAVELEQKLTKQQIFELYANQVDLGQRGSFTIAGFAEGARAYFNKDLESISLPEAALLAGLIQRPSALSPYRHPDRAVERRNLVLDTMVETGAITRAQADQAKATPLRLAPPNVEASDAPYFVDLVKDQLGQQYSDGELNENGYRIYTTLDPDLQLAAANAVQEGMKQVDAQAQKMRGARPPAGPNAPPVANTANSSGPLPQVALIALDPHTGDVLALVGGRNYGFSQLDHAIANRPTGSIFKPFVYAAAINTGLDGTDNPETPVSIVNDTPTVFSNPGSDAYQPRNYKGEYRGDVPLRYALAQSLNNATIKVAEQVGYDRIAQLARAAGINSVRPTPSMALGAYDAKPLDMAAAYTVFANGGVRLSPLMVRSLRNSQGDVLQDNQSLSKVVLDPRVAYVMTSMMEGVVNYGTGFEVRRRGFTAPAAGKTGTSHDAWFAGYTSNLLCVVWVGYDDYSDLRMSGAQSAAPIWADFMRRAVQLPEYRDVHEFPAPDGVVNVRIDKATNRLSTDACPDAISVAFLAGTEPKETCEQQPGEDNRGFFQKLLGIGSPPPSLPTPSPAITGHPANGQRAQTQPPKPNSNEENPNKKKGFFGRIVGIFKGDDDQESQPTPGN